MRSVARLLASLILVAAGAVTAVLPAQAVSRCNTSGTLGSPLVYNVGTRDPITVRSSVTTSNYVYKYNPERYCIKDIYGHAGYDLYIRCQNGIYWWQKTYGWQALRTDCSALGGSSWIDINEYPV